MAKAGRTTAGEVVDAFFWSERSGARTRESSAEGYEHLVKRLDETHDPGKANGHADLMATIQEQIIPRLVLAHFDDPLAVEACPDTRLPPDLEEIAHFSRLAASEDLPGALLFIEALVRQGLSIGTVLLHLIAPAARRLGEDWLEDLRSFAEVTVGLGTLQEVVHVLGPSFASGLGDRGSVLLVAAPSEQHTLGVQVLAEFIRRAGWTVEIDTNVSRQGLITRVESERFDMVGISISNGQLAGPLADLVSSVKRRSANPRLGVMIGGSLDLADQAGAIGATFCTHPEDVVRLLEAHAKGAGPN